MEKSQVVAADTPVLGDNSGAIQPGATFEPAATAVAVPVATDPAQPAEAAPLAAATTDSPLKAAPAAEPAPEVQPKRWRRPLAIALIVLALTGGGVFAARLAGQKNSASATDATQRFGQQSAPLASLSKQLGQVLGDANVLTVNGQLHVTNNLVLDPSAKPAAPTPGQLYYDQATNSLGYYNGKGFVYLQGGGNTFVTNNITNAAPVTNNNVTNVTNDNITNVTNVTNVTNPGGGFSGTGTAGTIAMFTAPGTLGDSVITQSGTNLTAGSLAGASATTIQGGTGNILIATAPNAGTGGGITIQTGDSSTTASGDVTVDTGAGVINGTIIGNKDFEDGTNDNVVNGFGFDTVIANSTAQAHTGTHSLALTMGNSGSYEIGEQAPYQTLAQPGHSYRFSAWVRAGTTARTFTFQTEFSSTGFSGGGSLGVSGWGSVTDSSGSWKQVSGTLVAPANTYALAIAFTSGAGIPNGEVHYIDDVTVTDLNSASAVSQLNLGAANAQQVTLGNLNQIQPTSIYGAGINMSGGLGVTNITGGSFNLSAAGASTISTGLGAALNITSGGSASWGTAGNLFGSTLTLHSGAAGGNNNGGDLILQSGAGSGTGVSGNITLDASQSSPVSGTLVDDRDFETGTQNLQAGSNTAVAQTNVAVHSGGFSLAATSGAAGNWEVAQDQGSAGVPVTPGHQYYFSAWVRADSVPETVHSIIVWQGNGTFTLNPVVENGSTWMNITGTATAPAGTTQAFWNFLGNDAGNNRQYFDDLQVIDLSSSTALSSLNLGANFMQGVNVGNQYQVGATNIQGGAGINIDSAASVLGLSGGTVNVVTPDDIAATGNIDIHSGASSTTASGNVTVDTGAGIVTGTVVDTRDFESGVDAMTAWFGDTIAQSSAQAHGGADSLAVTATGSFVGIIQDGNVSFVPIVAGHHYFFSAWVRAATTPRLWSPGIQWIGGAGSLALNTVTDSTSGWTQVTGSGIAPAGATGAIWKFSTSGESAGEIHYFDDFVTTDLSSSSAVSELDLGATNAQIITIGNMNELGATTINGGSGITMNSGQANFTVNGGAVTINGSGSSALSTSAGSLTLSGIDTSTWGLDTSLSGNGGDLTLHAGTGAGGGNNGGNLILQGGAADSTGTSGAVNINTMSGTGASGDILVQSGDSSTTASGNVTLDTGAGVVAGTPIFTADFEAGLDGFDNTPYGGTLAQSSAQAHGGANSLSLTLQTSSWNAASVHNIAVTPGHEYRWSVWIKSGGSSASGAATIYERSINQTTPPVAFTDNTSGWTQVSGSFINPAGNTLVDLSLVYQTLVGSPEVHYLDDATLTDLNSFTGLTANVGTTNAQAVNIGNINQLGDTNIYGSTTGIKLVDPYGNVNISSGTGVAITPSLDSSTAFQVQNANGDQLFNADTTNMRLSVGTVGTATAQLYVGGLLPQTPIGTWGATTNAIGKMAVNNGYAYIAEYGGSKMWILDVSNPANPVQLSYTNIGIAIPNDVVVHGRYAYISGRGAGGTDDLAIVDVSNPRNPSLVHRLDIPGSTAAGRLLVQGRYAYLEMQDATDDYLKIIDISNAGNPTTVGSLKIDTGLVPVSDMKMLGRYLYIPFYATSGTGLNIVDVSDPISPTSVATLPIGTTSSGLYQPQTISLKGRYAYIGMDNGTPANGELVDISDPTGPSLVSTYSFGTALNDYAPIGSLIEGNRLYTDKSRDGLIAVDDISDPTNPVFLGDIPGPGNDQSIVVDGRNLYTLGYFINPNLKIYDLGGGYIQNLQSGNVATGDFSATGDASITGNLNSAGGISTNSLNVQDDAGIGGGLSVTGATRLSGTFFQRPANDTTTAFQIQNSSGASVLDADTQNSLVGVGTNTPTARLTIAGKDATSGNTALAVIDGNGVSLGQIRDDGLVDLGVASTTIIGNTNSSGTLDGGVNTVISADKFTTRNTATTVTSLSIYIGPIDSSPNDQYQLAIYADDGSGHPGALVASSGVGTLTGSSWNTLAISASLTANTPYWFVYGTNSTNGSLNDPVYQNTTQPTHAYTTYSWTTSSGFPNPFGGSTINNTSHAFYANTTGTAIPAFTIGTNGNVGIGTDDLSDPAANLTVKTQTDNATAFEVQNAIGTALLTADTASMTVTVQKLVVSGDLNVNGHIVTGGSTPGIAAGAAACTSPTVSISGTDTSGTITVTTGTACPAGGTLATVTFATAFAAAPHVTITPGGAGAQALGAYVDDGTISTTTFDLGTTSTPSATTTYKWNYWTAQ